MTPPATIAIDLQGHLEKLASGKVRDLFEVDEERLLFVASDRISAFDVVMKNVSLNQLFSHHLPWPRLEAVGLTLRSMAKYLGAFDAVHGLTTHLGNPGQGCSTY